MTFLTKTLFKLASGKSKGCPTKLYYVNKDIYHNQSVDDSFLDALKEGGFQVGALAKRCIAGGVDLEDRFSVDNGAKSFMKEAIKTECYNHGLTS